MADAVSRISNLFLLILLKLLETFDFNDSNLSFTGFFSRGVTKLTNQSAKELIFDLTLFFTSVKTLLKRDFHGGVYLLGSSVGTLMSGTEASSSLLSHPVLTQCSSLDDTNAMKSALRSLE